MKIVQTAQLLADPAKPVCAAIGVFDGLHLGHQAILRQIQADARSCGGVSAAITFDRHPSTVVSPKNAPPMIYSAAKKLRVLESLGLDATLLLPFDESLSRQSAEVFARGLVRDFQRVHSLCVGHGFTFGYKRGGNLELLARLGLELGFQARGLASVVVDGITVSSTRIRDLIRAGDFPLAGRLLGRPYTLEGTVVSGDRLGRQIGFPTANMDTDNLLLPPHGVYAVRAAVEGRSYPAVLNLGRRPTLNSPAPPLRVEAHLLDFTGDLYGATLEVEFLSRLRAEQRFASLDELKSQIARDIAAARICF